MPKYLILFPVMLLPALAYAALAIFMGGDVSWLSATAFSIKMVSGDIWRISFSSIFLAFALGCFFIELLRTASPSGRSITVNLILACWFAPCAALFLLVRGFATDAYFLVCLMMLLDFMLDSAVLVMTSRRTVEVSRP